MSTTTNGSKTAAAEQSSPARPAMTAVKHDTLADALAAFQMELPEVHKNKDATIPGKDGKQGFSYSYADLAAVHRAGLPLLGRHGLAYIAKPTMRKGQFGLRYKLKHGPSGESERGFFPLSGGDLQKLGGAITYAKRYCFCAVTGIVAEEDLDGAGTERQDHSSRRQSRRGESFDQAAPAPGNRPRRQQQSSQAERPAPQHRPLDPEDPWRPKIDEITGRDDATAVWREIGQQLKDGQIDEARADVLSNAITARVNSLKAQAQTAQAETGDPGAEPQMPGPASDSQPAEPVAGPGENPEWLKEFTAKLWDAPDEAAVRKLQREIGQAIASKDITPQTANALFGDIAKRREQLAAAAKQAKAQQS